MPSRNRHCSRCPRRRGAAVIATTSLILIAALTPPARAFFGGFSGIVFDASNFAENIAQVQRLVQQVERAIQQVANQERMLERWGFGGSPAIAESSAGVELILDEAGTYEAADPGPPLDARFPREFEGVSPHQMTDTRAAWEEDYRGVVIRNRRLQNEAVQQMPATADRVRAIVEASNAAPGPTAAVQARNALAAELSGELARLQALRLARAEARVQRRARVQSEAAYADARRRWVMRDWSDPSPTEPIDMPFD